MTKMDFSFLNAEIIRVFTLNLLAVWSSPSYPFVFPTRIKRRTFDILKLISTALSNQYNKFAFIIVDKDGALARSSGFISKCHNMNIVVQTTGGYESLLNGKSEIPNKTLANITGSLLINSSLNTELWCLAYQYSIWVSHQTDNSLYGTVPYLLWNVSRPA